MTWGLLLGLLLLGPVTQAQSWTWALSSGNCLSTGTASDSAGNVYLVGRFWGTATFGATTLTAVGNPPTPYNLFVAKLTPTGTYEWVAQGFGTAMNTTRLALDRAGNVYVTGAFVGHAYFGNDTLPYRAGGQQAFVAKLSPTGVWQWARGAGTGRYEVVSNGVSTDSYGNVYFCGSFRGTVAFGSTALTSGGIMTDAFLAKLSPEGVWQWALRAGGGGFDYATDLAVTPQQEVYLSGCFQGTAAFGTDTLTSVGGSDDVFVARFLPDQSCAWAVQAGGNDTEICAASALGANGELYLTGSFIGNVAFGPTSLASTGQFDIFVARLSAAGTWDWATRTGGAADDRATGVATDSSGGVYVSGWLSGPVTVGSSPLPGFGQRDAFVARLTSTGTWQWGASGGGTADDMPNALALGSGGAVYLSGNCFGPAAFGQFPAGTGMFVARLDQTLTGLTEIERADFHLTPNPAHHTTRLTGLPPGATTAHIIDALGRTVRTSDLEPLTSDLSLQGLPPGLYVVRVGSVSRRLVVE